MLESDPTELKEFARRLLACEAVAGRPADPKKSAAFHVCERLRGPLGKVLGVRGFASLLARALTLAAPEVPWLRTLRIEADGALGGLDARETKLDATALNEGETVLVSRLLGLLETFIGPVLTLRLLCTIFGQSWTLNNSEENTTHEKN